MVQCHKLEAKIYSKEVFFGLLNEQLISNHYEMRKSGMRGRRRRK
jgi:hypothetical protein